MAYSKKNRWVMQGSAFALLAGGAALIFTAGHNHFGHPALVISLFTLVAMVSCGMGMRAISYLDEVQLRAEQTRWFWGSLVGFTLMFPVAIALMAPNTTWLDTTVQFVFHHSGTPPPRLYFALGLLLPIVFQVVAGLVLKLLRKLPRGSNA